MANPNESVNIGIEIDVEKAQKDLDTLTRTIQELNESTDDNEELVKELEKQWDKLDKAIKDAGTGQRNLSKELKEVTKQLQVMKLNGQDNTAEYQKLIAKAGALKDAMSDTSQAISKTASDTANLDAILSATSAVSGGFGLFTAGMSILGKDTQDVEKAQKKLMQAITLVNSVQQISNALNKDSALMVKLNAVANKLFEKQMKATAIATNTASTAMKKFKTALVSSGIGALVVVLGAIVAKMIEWNEKQEQTEQSANRLVGSYKQANMVLENMNKSLSSQLELYQKYGATQESIEQLQFQMLKNNKTMIDNNVKQTKAEITALRLKKNQTEEEYQQIKDLEAELRKLEVEQKEINKQYAIEEALQKAKKGYLTFNQSVYKENIEYSEKQIKNFKRELEILDQQNEAYKFQNNTELDMVDYLQKKQELNENILQEQKLIAEENIKSITATSEALIDAIDSVPSNILSEAEKKDMKEGQKKIAENQIKEFRNQINDLNDELKDIATKTELERQKAQKANANKTAENLISQQQAEVNSAKMVADQKRKIFEDYSKDEGANLETLLKYREDYVSALNSLNEKEKKLLSMQQKNEETNASGNASKLKTITANYANANKELLNDYTNTIKGINEITQNAFLRQEEEIQNTLDMLSSEIDNINSKTKDLKFENYNYDNRGGFMQTRQDADYVAEKTKIDKQRELYAQLYKDKTEYAIIYADLVKSLDEEEFQLDLNYTNKKKELWKNAIIQIGGYVGSTLSSIADMQDTNTKQGFERAKQLQYASTVVNTLSAMMGAYRSMIEIPVVGPALAVASMATAGATGVAQLAQIKKQKFNTQDTPSSNASSANASAKIVAGTSNVNTAILSRNIQSLQQPKTEYVAIVDEITYKQKQQTNIQKVSVV